MLTAALVISCSQAENKNALPKPTVAPTQTAVANVSTPASPTSTPVVSNAAAPPVSRVKSLPPEGGDKPTAAEYNGYQYSFTKDGEKTVATFGPKPLPADKGIIVDAMRDVIFRSYGDKVDSAPRVEGTGAARSIHITGNKHEYVVVVGRDQPNGEIHSLIITLQN